ncbi:MAG: DedA family protein [Flavobacteriales bacterium]|nr:DedA family protein [Flavobacteriales bacterium]
MELGPVWEQWGLVGLFLGTFLAATLLPLSSEALLAVMAMGPWPTLTLLGVATAGNWLGGMSTYAIGRWGAQGRLGRWVGLDSPRAQAWAKRAQRHGPWLAWLCWAPLVGDLIAAALGLFKAPVGWTALWMFAGKLARYAVVLAVLR